MSQSAGLQWHYLVGSEQKGPFSVEQMAALVHAGTVTDGTLVWAAGMAGWVPFAESPLGRGVPPPAPGMRPSPGAGYGSAQTGGQFTSQNAGAFATSVHDAARRAAGSSGPAADFVAAVATCLTKYTTFAGRAARPEFWYFVLFLVLGNIAISIVDSVLVRIGLWFSPLGLIFALATFLPGISVAVRRLHDTDRSGWWVWIGLVPLLGFVVMLVFYCMRGTQGRNRFG